MFWGGDLNYRIDMPRQEVLDTISASNFSLLWVRFPNLQLKQHDQLNKQKVENPSHGLWSFKEQPLDFAPTFKYNRNSNQYDTSEKMRIPAYCDRILYRGSRIIPHTYQRLECKMSDHRPVSATFTCKVLQMDETNLRRVESDVQIKIKSQFDQFVWDARLDFFCNWFGIDRIQGTELLQAKPFLSYFPVAE